MSSLLLVLYFSVGRFAYSIATNRNWAFLSVELALIGLFLYYGLAFMFIGNPALTAGLLGITFAVTGIASRVAVPIALKLGIDLWNEPLVSKVPVGIIDFTWITLMGAALSIIYFLIQVPPLSGLGLSLGLPTPYLLTYHENVLFLLERLNGGIFGLGTILAAAMAILWAGEIWLKSEKPNEADEQERERQYRSLTFASVKMGIAFFVILVGLLLWLGLPLYRRMVEVTELMKTSGL